jgi:lysophospholipase L1-like esterase
MRRGDWRRASERLAAALAALGLALGATAASAEHAFENEILAFEAADRVDPPPAHAVVFVGSSTFRLWEDLASVPSPIPALNRGFGGSTLPDVRWYADRVILRYEPAAVVIYGGDNDLALGRTPADVERDVEELVEYLEAKQPELRLGFVSIKPSPARAWLLDATRDANARIALLMAARPARRRFLDTFSAMLGPTGELRPELYASDGLHMNASGYGIWAPLVRGLAFDLVPTVDARLELRVPAGAGNAPLFLTGNLPSLGPWHADALRLEGVDETYGATLRVPIGATLEYKYTRGSWATVEKSAAGADVPNRRLACTTTCATLDTVLRFGGAP